MAEHNEVINLQWKGLEKQKEIQDFLNDLANKNIGIKLNYDDKGNFQERIRSTLKQEGTKYFRDYKKNLVDALKPFEKTHGFKLDSK